MGDYFELAIFAPDKTFTKIKTEQMMDKQRKISMEEAEKSLSVLSIETKNALKGGCSYCEGWEAEGATVYSQEEYNYLSSQSLWTGGNVCGLGYVPGTETSTTATEDDSTTLPLDEIPGDPGNPGAGDPGGDGDDALIPEDVLVDEDLLEGELDDDLELVDAPTEPSEEEQVVSSADGGKSGDKPEKATPDPIPFKNGSTSEIYQGIKEVYKSVVNDNDFNLSDVYNAKDAESAGFKPKGQGMHKAFKTENGRADISFFDSTKAGSQHAWQNDIHEIETDNYSHSIRLRHAHGWTVATIDFDNETDYRNYREEIGW